MPDPTAEKPEVVHYDRELFPALLDMDPDEAAGRIIARYQRAETLDDLFDVLEGNTSKTLVGHKFQFRSVAWAPYESDRGVIPLAICDAVDLDTGEETEFATTGQMLVQFLRRAELIGAYPFEAKLTATKTNSKRDALNFERV